MLSKINRLSKDEEIKKIVKSGQTFFLPQFVIKYQNHKESNIKIGFVVSTKVDKRATARNLLKRRMREAMRALLPNMKQNYSVLIIAKKQALSLSFVDIRKQLEFAFSKIKLYNIVKDDK